MSFRYFLTLACGFAIGVALIAGLDELTSPQRRHLARVAYAPPFDPQFVAVGRAYLPQLGKAYGDAWQEGASQLEGGQSVETALDAVSKGWVTRRTQLFDQVISPAFNKIVPESTADADVTPAERAALAAAWRGLAQGLTPGSP